jgi:hypothetical protein
MNENMIGEEVADAAVKVHRELGPGNLMKDGIERVVNGLAEENLSVFAALRDIQIEVKPDAAPRDLSDL